LEFVFFWLILQSYHLLSFAIISSDNSHKSSNDGLIVEWWTVNKAAVA